MYKLCTYVYQFCIMQAFEAGFSVRLGAVRPTKCITVHPKSYVVWSLLFSLLHCISSFCDYSTTIRKFIHTYYSHRKPVYNDNIKRNTQFVCNSCPTARCRTFPFHKVIVNPMANMQCMYLNVLRKKGKNGLRTCITIYCCQKIMYS